MMPSHTPEQIPPMRLSELRCNGCTACCRGDHNVVLDPEKDDIETYQTRWEPVHPNLMKGMEDSLMFFALKIFEKRGKIPAEDAAQLRAQGVTHLALNLECKPNGDCIYLGEHGCTIYDRRPSICREFDCRVMFLSLSRNERRQWIKSGFMGKDVFKAACERVTGANEAA